MLRVPAVRLSVTSDRTTLDDLFGYVVQPWQRDALCREPEYQPLPWVPERGVDPHLVLSMRAVCARCMVQAECRAAGIEHDERGIWGGLTGLDRQRLRLTAV